MVRHPDPFELEEEDFLKALPKFDSLLFGEIDPPAWALRAQQKRGGKRHPKREVTYGASTHGGYGYSSSGTIVPWRPGASPSTHVHSHSDAESIYQKSMAKERRRKQGRHSQQQVAQRKLVPKGNLLEDDYKYWKGFALIAANASEGTCRWCGILHKSRPAMLRHHDRGSCKQHLAALYKFAKLSRQRYCFACKAETHQDRWGIPMCDRMECISRWKFNFNMQLPGFQQYRRWALEAQLKDPSNGPFAQLPVAVGIPDDDDFKGTPC